MLEQHVWYNKRDSHSCLGFNNHAFQISQSVAQSLASFEAASLFAPIARFSAFLWVSFGIAGKYAAMELASIASLAPMREQSAGVLFRFRNEVLEIGVSCRQGGEWGVRSVKQSQGPSRAGRKASGAGLR